MYNLAGLKSAPVRKWYIIPRPSRPDGVKITVGNTIHLYIYNIRTSARRNTIFARVTSSNAADQTFCPQRFEIDRYVFIGTTSRGTCMF